MTIYELEKLATPGPLIISEVFGVGQTLATADDSSPVCFCDCAGHDGKADAAMLAHRYNSFMRALEALKQQVQMCEECDTRPATRWYLDTNPDETRWFCDECKHYPSDGIADGNIALVKLIAELEEVK